MAYDQRIIDIAKIAAEAAAKNARVAPQLLSADIIFTLADAVEDGRLILGPATLTNEAAPAGEVGALIASARGHLANIRAHGNAEANACIVIERALDMAEARFEPSDAAWELAWKGSGFIGDEITKTGFRKAITAVLNAGIAYTPKAAPQTTPDVGEVDAETEAEIANAEKAKIVAYLRRQADLGADYGIASEKGSTRRAAFGGGSLALARAADAIEADEHLAALNPVTNEGED